MTDLSKLKELYQGAIGIEAVDEILNAVPKLIERLERYETALERVAIAHETKGACMKDAVAKLARKALENK